MPACLIDLVARFGYLAVFGGVFLESAGLPVPGETLLLSGAFFAHRGLLALPWVVGVAALAAVLGDNLGYLIGHRAGRPFVEHHGPRVGLTPGRLAAIDRLFARHGAQAVFLARFVTGVRVFAAVSAGVARIPWPRFLVWNAAGALVWSAAIGLAGYLLGETVLAAERWLGRAGLFAAGTLGALALTALAWRHGRHLVRLVAGWVPVGLGAREGLLVLGNIVAIWVFAAIADEVLERETTGFDEAVAQALYGLRSPLLDLAMWGLTLLGSVPVLALVVAAVGVAAAHRGERRAAIALVGVAAVEAMLNTLLKLAFERDRPDLWSLVARPQDYSFPSGHAMGAAAIYGFAAVVLARLVPGARPLLAVGTLLLVAAIGTSRVYLGVHWPTDVLAGFAAGTVLLLVGVYLVGGRAAPPASASGERGPHVVEGLEAREGER